MLLTVADEKDNQVVVQDEAGQALSGLDRHQRSADPGRDGKKKSIMRVKKTKEKGTKNRNKEQKKGSRTKKTTRKSRKETVNKKGKRNNRNSKGKKISGKNKKTKERKINKDKKSKRSKKEKKTQKKLKIGRKIQRKNGMKEQREGKEKKKGTKKRTKSKKKNQMSKDSTCLPIVCIDNAIKALNQEKGKVVSFEKQLKRYGKLVTQAEKKVGKKGVFKPALMRLMSEGGGNASGLSCGGNLTNAGALQMQNLSSLLTACEGQVFFCFSKYFIYL